MRRAVDELDWPVQQDEDLGEIAHDRVVLGRGGVVAGHVQLTDLLASVVEHVQEAFGVRPQLVQLADELVPVVLVVDELVFDGLLAELLVLALEHHHAYEHDDEAEHGAADDADEDGLDGVGDVGGVAHAAHQIGGRRPVLRVSRGALVDAASRVRHDELCTFDAAANRAAQAVRLGAICKREKNALKRLPVDRR